MEETHNKYHNGKIYKITNIHNNNVYIGSTYTTLKKRLWKHETDLRGYMGLPYITKTGIERPRKPRDYRTSFECMYDNDYNIELIKDVKCESRKELFQEEQKVLNEFRTNKDINVVNKKNPCNPKNKKYLTFNNTPISIHF